jgi:hypothetical protein
MIGNVQNDAPKDSKPAPKTFSHEIKSHRSYWSFTMGEENDIEQIPEGSRGFGRPQAENAFALVAQRT